MQMGHTTISLEDAVFIHLKKLRKKLEDKGGIWTYSEIIKYLLKEVGEYEE